MAGLLEGRYALITGGAQGIGQGVARAFARAGIAGLVIAQRSRDGGEQEAAYLRDNCGIDAHAMVVDVTDRGQVEAMVKATVERFNALDILVNNAGTMNPRRLEAISDEDMEQAFVLNYWSAFWAMRAVFPTMKARNYGRIINMGSLAGVNGQMYSAPYNASKEALRSLSRTAAVEWGQFGIAVNVICPFALSPVAKHYFDQNPDMANDMLEQIPSAKFGDAEEDIGPAAVFFASEGANYSNGNTLFVSGGSHINGTYWRPEAPD